jgi:hypothetical protein
MREFSEMDRAVRIGLAACVAALALAAAAAAPATAQASLKAMWGPNELPDGSSAFPMYRRLGVDVLQLQVRWERVARSRPAGPRNPDDPAYVWPANVEEAAREARRHGIRLALMIMGTPAWANGNQPWSVVPTNVADYADFAVAVARRYPRVRHWMIWGEPSQAYNFRPQERNGPAGPRAYAQLLDAAYGVLKRHNRRNIVIGGNTWTLGGEVRPTDFVRWMRLPNGRPPRLDWFGHNPFTTRFPSLRRRPYQPGLRDFSDIDTFVGEVRRTYRRIGRRPRLWLSEFCISSDRDNRLFNFHVSRRRQARWLTAAYRIANRTPYVAGLGWFKLLDEPFENGLTTGLLTARGNRKPAYHAYRRAR